MPQEPTKTARAPRELAKSGRALWRAVMGDFDLSTHEESVLLQACRTADHLDALTRAIEADGVMSESSQGSRVHPALVEHRQQSLVLARLLTALRIPDDDESRNPARPGTRGVYGITGVAT